MDIPVHNHSEEGLMKKLVALATVIAGLGASAAFGATHVAASTACVSVSAQVTVNGTDVVNQTVGQCTP